MLKHYLLLATRQFKRQGLHSAIHVVGLTIGITSCILIALYVRNELTFDRFHEKADRIYRVYARENWGENQIFFNTVTPFPMGPALKDNLPEVEAAVRICPASTQVKLGDKKLSEPLAVVDNGFFKVFDFQTLEGDASAALADPNGVVLTQSLATKYVGQGSAIGHTLSLMTGEKWEDYTVKAVVQDPPTNSSIRFGLMIGQESFKRLYSPRVLQAWFNILPETYVLLAPEASPADVTAKLPALMRQQLGDEEYNNSHYEAGFQPITSIHLDPSFPKGIAPVGNPAYVYVLVAAALLILLAACINFITMSVGRSMLRAREVGIRKVAGAARYQLIMQFMGEALLLTLISLLLGWFAAVGLLPSFSQLSGINLNIPGPGFLITTSAVLVLLIGIVSGSYPALLMSGFMPASIIKGVATGGGKQTTRRVLVGLQLIVSIFFISATLVMGDQLDFLRNKDLGFNKESLVVVPLPEESGRLADRIKAGMVTGEKIGTEFSRLSGVTGYSIASHDFGTGAWTEIGFKDQQQVYRTAFVNIIDQRYLSTLNIGLTEGRFFSDSIPGDVNRGILVNEKLVSVFGLKDPIGKKLPGSGFPDHEIIGVVKDFNYASLYSPVAPLILLRDPRIAMMGAENVNIQSPPEPKMIVRLSGNNAPATIQEMKTIFEQITNSEFSYSFVDESLGRQYQQDGHLGVVVSLATVLAVIIGALGLFGLASLTMHTRIREIAIRKVLGASMNSLMYLLSREYILLIGACLILSVPITWYAMQKWLQAFEYRISVSGTYFLAAGFVMLFTGMLAISYHLIGATRTNPVNNLRSE